MIARTLSRWFPGLDWAHFFSRINKLRIPSLRIYDFSLVDKLTRIYFFFTWDDIVRRGGGWCAMGDNNIRDYRIIIGKTELHFEINYGKRGALNRRRLCVRCYDIATGAPVGPRFDYHVSVWDYIQVLQWIDLNNR